MYCTEHCKENHQKPLLMKLFHALDICPASSHKSPAPSQRPLPQETVRSLILLLLNSKLLTFSLGSNTPDWKFPVSKEALQHLRQSPEEPEALQGIPPSSHPPVSLTVPQDTGNTQETQVKRAPPPAPSCQTKVRTQTNPFNGIVTLFFRKWFCSKVTVSVFHCLCRIRHHRSHEFPHHSQSGYTIVKICGC